MFQNVLMAMQNLIIGMDQLKMSYEREENAAKAKQLMSTDYRDLISLDAKWVSDVLCSIFT